MTVYRIILTNNRTDRECIRIPAESLTDAYIAALKKHPNAEILSAKPDEQRLDTETASAKWARCVAKHLIANATLEETATLADTLDGEMLDELIEAICKEWHRR